MLLRINIWLPIGLLDSKKWLLALLMMLGVSCNSYAAATILRVTLSNADGVTIAEPSYYFEHLLRLSLEKTRQSDGDFEIVHYHHGGGIERDRALLTAGMGIDVMWGSVTRDRQKSMRVIPLDLLKTLNNYRVLLIRAISRQFLIK